MLARVGAIMPVLAGVQFQRVLLARSLLGKPDMLMLDEATQGLDQPGSAQFYRLIAAIGGLRVAVLFNTPVGPTIVCIAAGMFADHTVAAKLRG